MTAVPALVTPLAFTINDRMLRQWQSALIKWVRSDRPDLSNRQLAILLVVADGPAPHTVRGLAACLTLTKPAVSRALDRLAELEYVRRVPDRTDRRSVFIVATKLGELLVHHLAADFDG